MIETHKEVEHSREGRKAKVSKKSSLNEKVAEERMVK